MSQDVRRSSKSFLQELLGYPNGIQIRHMKFCGSSDSNCLRTRATLARNGYVQAVLIDGYNGAKITNKGREYLRYLLDQ